MKKVLVVLLCCVFLFSFNLVTAQQNQFQQGVHEAGTGITDLSLKESNQGDGQNDQQGQENDGQVLDRGLQAGDERSALRRNRVSSVRQYMLEIAERNQGIGQQIRNIAQNQVQVQEEAENALGIAQRRGSLMKFLIGPNYGELKKVENRLNQHNQNLEELKVLREDIESEEDAVLFDEQIQAMEEVKQEMENELRESRSSFSLFGWMNKMFNF